MKRSLTQMCVVLLAALSLSFNAYSAGDPQAGQTKAAVCQACHGADGNGLDDSYPRLAGQHESYLAKALGDYRAGKRKNPIMGPMAAALSDQDIKDLAAYYSAMSGLTDLSGN